MAKFFELGEAGESYCIQRDSESSTHIKEHIEYLWDIFEPYAEPGFREEAKIEEFFSQKMWELYCGATMRFHGKNIVEKGKKGPDHLLCESLGKVWVEDIAVTSGVGPDAVPPLRSANVLKGESISTQTIPEDEMALRITHGLREKFYKYERYCENDVVKQNEPYVIAINRGAFLYPDHIPLVLKAVFSIGQPFMRFDPETGEHTSSGWTREGEIFKINGAPVPKNFFQLEEFAGISAVIYCKENICSIPKILGDDMYIVHNPLARNPLPREFFPFGFEYFVNESEYVVCKDNRASS